MLYASYQQTHCLIISKNVCGGKCKVNQNSTKHYRNIFGPKIIPATGGLCSDAFCMFGEATIKKLLVEFLEKIIIFK